MKKTVSKSKVRSTNDTERTPLVRDSQNTYTGNISDGGTSTDWDTASLEQREITHKKSVPTESMNNYLVFGSSTDTNTSNDTQIDVKVKQSDHVTSDTQKVDDGPMDEAVTINVEESSNQKVDDRRSNSGIVEVDVHNNIEVDRTGLIQSDSNIPHVTNDNTRIV
jgi:hypothetical protein